MKFGSKIQNLHTIEWKNSEMLEYEQLMMNQAQGAESNNAAGQVNSG